MALDLGHWLLTHAVYIGIGIAVFVGYREWRAEFTARIIAEQQMKINEAQVKSLQQAISDRDKAAAVQVAPIVKIIHDVQTPAQAVAALPQVVNTPLPQPVQIQPNNSVLIPEPDVLPIFNQVADDKVCRIQLDTATKDLTDTKNIVVQKDAEIVVLKKKPSFFKRVTGVAKAVGIGVGIGLLLGHV